MSDIRAHVDPSLPISVEDRYRLANDIRMLGSAFVEVIRDSSGAILEAVRVPPWDIQIVDGRPVKRC